MTDEQWLWLFANQSLDSDEKLEAMCPDCRMEVTQEKRCIRCGKKIADVKNDDGEFESYTSKTFDMEKYEAMKNKTYKLASEDDSEDIEDADIDLDLDLVAQLMNGGE